MYYIFLLASATLLVLFSLITFGRWYLGHKQKSKRPVDALAVKAYITHLLTTWNQEMLAHLKKGSQKNQDRIYTLKIIPQKIHVSDAEILPKA